jgi:DNA-directed RNA polymerase I, II, and III subunit RPABC3
VDFYWVCYQVRQENQSGKALKQRLKGRECVYDLPPLNQRRRLPNFSGGNRNSTSLPGHILLRLTSPLRTPHIPKYIFSEYKEIYTSTMAASGDSTLFEESFTITDYDQSKYDRVARISAVSLDSATALTLDINIELYPLQKGESFSMMLASTLSLDGNKEEESKGWRDVGNESTLADMFDYVCHGKIYKFEDVEEGQTM